MAAKSPRMAKDAGKTYPPTTDSINEMPGGVVSSEPVSRLNTPQRAAVDAIFRNEAGLRQAITENLTTLRPESDAVAKRVQEAFETFNPSNLSKEELARRHYVAPGADPGEVLKTVIMRGVEALRSAKAVRTLTLRDSAELKALIKEAPESTDSALQGVIELGPLIDFINSKSQGSSLVTEPTYTLRQAGLEAEKILDAVENPSRSGNVDGAANREDASSETREADQLVNDHVHRQMKSATAPESKLAYGKIPNSADEDKVQSGILQTFQLRPGASDVTSYHDFHTLQIAFEHVWTEISDGKLASLGRDLYSEYVKLKDFSGSGQPDLQVSTIGDLRRLMEEVKKLSQIVEDATPPPLRPTEGGGQTGKGEGDNTLEDWVRGLLAVGTGGGSELIRLAVEVFASIGNKPLLRWDDFRGQLPGGDKIEVDFATGAASEGTVEIVLSTEPNSHWKGIQFKLFDPETNRWSDGAKISNDHPDTGYPNANGSSVATTTLSTSLIARGVLVFSAQVSNGNNTERYVLGDLIKECHNRRRVYFKWKDR
jgi:hypothetical protein